MKFERRAAWEEVMGLFTKKNPTIIPAPYLRGLRGYGEQLAGEPTNYNPDQTADLDMINFAQRDTAGYVEMLAAHISSDSGAFCLGVAETVVSVMRLDVSTQAWDRIVDGAIEYLRGRGIPYDRTKPYMRTRWAQNHSPEEW
jgi:hypothetical protein